MKDKQLKRSMSRVFSQAMQMSARNPAKLMYWSLTWVRQQRKAQTRSREKEAGIQVPPILIFSCTHSCNLNCQGCYAQARNRDEGELPLSRIRTFFSEASELGVGIILIAGGEPLTRPEVLWAAGEQKDIIFPVFTNGLLLNQAGMAIFREHPNLVPVISVEGGKYRTEQRRGKGIYGQVLSRMEGLKQAGKNYGLSFTLTRNNYEEVTHPVWMRNHQDLGASLFFYVEYVPQSESEMELCLTPEQKADLPGRVEKLKKQLRIPIIALPGDEDRFQGCLASGRGFAHVSVSGQLEPCPFAPYSDSSLQDLSLREALQSPFLQNIRENHHLLGESKGGCTLWENREELGIRSRAPGAHSAILAD